LNKKYNLRFLFLTFTIIWTAFIFYNSLQDANESSSATYAFIRYIAPLLNIFSIDTNSQYFGHFIRKLAHFTEFTIQSVLINITFIKYRVKMKKFYIYTLFFGLLTAVTDEFIQLFSDGRSSQVSDVLLDFSGVVAGLLLTALFNIKKKN